MTRTMMLLVPAILIVPLATDLVTVQTSRAEPAVNECKTKPDSSAPAGSHWYYRVNRADQRHCWYLGPEGAKARQAAAPRQRAAATPSAPATAESHGEATADQNLRVTDASSPWSALAKPAGRDDLRKAIQRVLESKLRRNTYEASDAGTADRPIAAFTERAVRG